MPVQESTLAPSTAAPTAEAACGALPPGPPRDALAAALKALDIAERMARPAPLAQSLAQVGRCYRGVGALEAAEWYLQRALRWSPVVGVADFGLELLCDLAEVAVQQAEALRLLAPEAALQARERARDRCFEAAGLSSATADAGWEVHALLRIADVLDRCGDHDDAVNVQCRALHLLCRPSAPALDPSPERYGAALM